MQTIAKTVIKTAMVLFLAVFLVLIYTSDNAKDVPMEQIASRIKEIESVTEMQERDKGDLQRYYSISESDTNGYIYYKDISPMSVNELLIIKASSKAQADSFLEAAEAHEESQENIFGSYGTDQMALLKEASVESRGNYVWYMCGPDAAVWLETLTDII